MSSSIQSEALKNVRQDTVATRARIVAVAEQLFARHGIDAVSLSRVNQAARQRNRTAVQYHFGAEDTFIPADVIDQVRSADPSGEVYVYEGAGHGFNCDDRESYDETASVLSEKRSLAFLARHLD